MRSWAPPLEWMILIGALPLLSCESNVSKKSPNPPKAPSSRCGAQGRQLGAISRRGAAPQPLEIGPFSACCGWVSATDYSAWAGKPARFLQQCER